MHEGKLEAVAPFFGEKLFWPRPTTKATEIPCESAAVFRLIFPRAGEAAARLLVIQLPSRLADRHILGSYVVVGRESVGESHFPAPPPDRSWDALRKRKARFPRNIFLLPRNCIRTKCFGALETANKNESASVSIA